MKRWSTVAVICICGAAAYAADDHEDMIRRIRANVAAQLAHWVNYTCVQTVERTYYLRRMAEIGRAHV